MTFSNETQKHFQYKRKPTRPSHLDIPGYKENVTYKRLKMATLVSAIKAGIKQTIIVMIIVTGKNPKLQIPNLLVARKAGGRSTMAG